MSLSVDGIWKSGVWAETVWADGLWREGEPSTLVANPGFESGDFSEWRLFTHEDYTCVEDNAHTGSFAARGTSSETNAYDPTITQTFSLPPATKCTASVWVARDESDLPTDAAELRLRFASDDGFQIKQFEARANPDVSGYQQLSLQVIAPDFAAKVLLQGAVLAFNSGSWFFDDFSLTLEEPPPPPPSTTNQFPAGRSHRRRYVVEIDGQAFDLRSLAEARALLEQARKLAPKQARQQIERVARPTADAAPQKIELPRIAVSDPALEQIANETRAAIAEIYQRAQRRLLGLAEAQMRRDDEEAVLTLLLH